ncbi:AbgT family transporter [Aureisphaera galaxeae]|uniref:AbgT family transporter n=1 Tax=Aureisphaera galaxeae TaxID=1538023 RepID=UPI00234FDF85|nr:AbgT family transporter [Aureisphaera galaxeae]MDC8003376.1 AbgT family transporter [Aureisphaera galaxeae]
MELEEMKTLWENMSERMEKLEVLNKQNIMEMTELKYRNKFNKLRLYETSGAVVCYIIGLGILLNLDKLDTWYLMACGVFCMLFLFVMPIFTLGSINRLTKLNLSSFSYKEILVRFEKAKRRTLVIQRISIASGVLLMFATIPVADKLLNGNDFFQNEIKAPIWYAIVFALIFLALVSRWGYGWYMKITQSAENVLKDLED